MKTKTMTFDQCVRSRIDIKKHEVVVINDLPINGKMIDLIRQIIDFDTPISIIHRYHSFTIDSIVALIESFQADDLKEHIMPIISANYLCEVVVLFDALQSKANIEVEQS